jgi:hypothetical protein
MTRVSRNESGRPKRIPVSEANRDKMTVKGLDHENYVYRWVNDVGDRLATFVLGWWEFVDQNGQPVGDGGIDNSAGTSSKLTKAVGRGVTAYMMRIPREFWLADQKKKEDKLRETEQTMLATAKSHGDYGKVEVSIKNTV